MVERAAMALASRSARIAADAPARADLKIERRCRRLAGSMGLVVAAIGVVSLIAILSGAREIVSLRPDWVSMKVNTALGLTVAGAALALACRDDVLSSRLARAGAIFVGLLGAVTLLEYLMARDFGIDRLLVAEAPGAVGTMVPGRMAIVTTACFMLSGAATLALTGTTTRRQWLPGAVAAPVLLISSLALVGYMLGASELYSLARHVTAIAAPTAFAFTVLSAGVIAAKLDHSFLRELASPHSGGVLLRRLLPVALVSPVVIVWIRFKAQAAHIFSSVAFGDATIAVATMVVFSAALLWSAALLDSLDRERLLGEAKIIGLNAEIQERVRALETANAEMEGFSYAMSHVLRAPLRAIDGFSRLLEEECGASLGAEGARRLGVIRDNARQMGEMIDAIESYLRLGRAPMSIVPVDMNKAARTALDALEPKTRGRSLKFVTPPLPSARGDADMLQRIWRELLDNAVKFTAPKAGAVIDVGATAGVDQTTYFVRDEGVGFEPQYAEKVFGVFQRLHGAEFGGEGMGLPIVRRIVERHGGRVWAEGRPGQGATFYFSLPTKEDPHA